MLIALSNSQPIVFQNGTSGSATLTVNTPKRPDACGDIAPGTYGIHVPFLTPLQNGNVQPVMATNESHWPHFYLYDNNKVEPAKTDAAQLWFCMLIHCPIILFEMADLANGICTGCKQWIRDTQYYVLNWGLRNQNGTVPVGCDPTDVVQKFDIPCADVDNKKKTK